MLFFSIQNKRDFSNKDCVDCITFNVASYGDSEGRALLKFSWLIVETNFSCDITYPHISNLGVDKSLNMVLLCYICDKLPLRNVICKMNEMEQC
jgi:hypothetical protein